MAPPPGPHTALRCPQPSSCWCQQDLNRTQHIQMGAATCSVQGCRAALAATPPAHLAATLPAHLAATLPAHLAATLPAHLAATLPAQDLTSVHQCMPPTLRIAQPCIGSPVLAPYSVCVCPTDICIPWGSPRVCICPLSRLPNTTYVGVACHVPLYRWNIFSTLLVSTGGAVACTRQQAQKVAGYSPTACCCLRMPRAQQQLHMVLAAGRHSMCWQWQAVQQLPAGSCRCVNA
jgi:hypothetical protein